MALPALSPEQRQAALEKAREARAARSALLAGLKAGTVTLADVLARDDDIARRTSVAQVVRALPGVGQARTAAVMERAGISPERRVGGLGARQREQIPEPSMSTCRAGSETISQTARGDATTRRVTETRSGRAVFIIVTLWQRARREYGCRRRIPRWS